ncbi:DDE-type integrase/transposase/recombinase [Streptomyces sp. GD-15H]|uniref:DDE-type integrase/transposase/recombinase n=1 Tax=Streptomyces sp. GD-15H TaxID=3129112 RepID=UPI0038733D14
MLVQNRRDTAAARRFFRRLLKTTRAVPRMVVTGKLRSHGTAHRQVMPSGEHRCPKGLNHRAENSHQPTRRHEHAGNRCAPPAQRSGSRPPAAASHRASAPTATRWPPPAPAPRRPSASPSGTGPRRCRPAHHGLTTGPGRGPTTPRPAVRQSRTPQRDNAVHCSHSSPPSPPSSEASSTPVGLSRAHIVGGSRARNWIPFDSCPFTVATIMVRMSTLSTSLGLSRPGGNGRL